MRSPALPFLAGVRAAKADIALLQICSERQAMSSLLQVKASAGSGKTFELTRRFLQHIVRCEERSPRSPVCLSSSGGGQAWGDILAITFTNAAATEMRDRVVGQLKRAALGSPAPGLDLSPEHGRLWTDTIVRDMSALNIRTIDSLLHLVARTAALDLDLPPDFQPVFATEEALTPYLDLLLERSRHDESMRTVLRSAFTALAHRDTDTGFLAGEKLLDQLRPLFDAALREELDDLSSPEKLRQRQEALCRQAMHDAKHLLSIAKKLPWQKKALTAVTAAANGEHKNSAYFSKDEAAKLFLKGASIQNDVQEAFQALAASQRDMQNEVPLLKNALWLHPCIQLARLLAEAFKANRQQESGIPGMLVPRLVRQILESEHGVPTALCRMGVRLTHFLVDEFQDTSREHWTALRPLVEEALARGGSLTWVGDVKQSIYSWRGGDAELFDSVLDDAGLTALAPDAQRHVLPFNWRSRREIVEYNNRLFGQLEQNDIALAALTAMLPGQFPQDLLLQAAKSLAHAFSEARQGCPDTTPDGGTVRTEQIRAEKSADLGEAVLERLCALLRDIAPERPWADVLILVRSNDKASLIASRLAAERIPVVTENSLRLAEHPLVAQTVALLSFLDNPGDDIAFLAVIAGSIFRQHPEAQELANTNLEDWAASPGTAPLFRRFRQRWPAVWQSLLAPFHSHAGLMTPYDMVLEWFSRLDVEARFPEADTFLRRFMEVLYSAEEKGQGTLATFLDHWHSKSNEEKVPMPDHMDAVRVMTIHKAKGLEAPVVIVPWTDFRARPSSSPVVLEREGLRMAVHNRKETGNAYFAEMIRQAKECIHLLYVACTRAREALHVFCTATDGNNATASQALEFLLRGAQISFDPMPPAGGREIPDAPDEQKPHPKAPPAARPFDVSWRPMDWLPRLKIFRSPLHALARGRTPHAYGVQGQEPFFSPEERGRFFHFCLEHVHCTGDARADAHAAVIFGARHFPLPVPTSVVEGLTRSLEWFLAQPQTALWLENGWPEHPLLDASGDLLRMDMLVPEPWGPLILEYKSGQPDPAHIAQIRNYLLCHDAAKKPLSPPAKGLLVYLDLQKFQMVDAESVSALCDNCSVPLPREVRQ